MHSLPESRHIKHQMYVATFMNDTVLTNNRCSKCRSCRRCNTLTTRKDLGCVPTKVLCKLAPVEDLLHHWANMRKHDRVSNQENVWDGFVQRVRVDASPTLQQWRWRWR